jgi:hypothetical protein
MPTGQSMSPAVSLVPQPHAPEKHSSEPLHGTEVPGAHVPLPSHAAGVNVFPVHEPGQLVPDATNVHAPVPLQPVAPHAPPMGEHAAVQQLPVPVVPQTPDVH